MPQSNVSSMTARGMFNPSELTDSEKDFLNALKPEEAQQLVAMWERMGKPDMPSDGNVVGFF